MKHLPLLFILLVGLLKQLNGDSVDSVNRSSTTVATASTITATVTLTTSATSVSFGMPVSFTQSTSLCNVNSTSSACTLSTNTTQTNLTFTGGFATGKWVFQFSVTNPYYQTNFEMITYKSTAILATTNITTGVVKLQPTCTLTTNSNVVGATTTGNFTIGTLNFVPAGSLIFLYFENMTALGFPQIVPVPDTVSCTGSSSSTSCMNTGENELNFYVSGLFAANTSNQPASFTFSSIINSGFNGSLGSVSISVTDSNTRIIATCTAARPAPSVLSTSTFTSDNNWVSSINSVSTTTCQIFYKVYIPTSFSLRIVYPLNMTLQVNVPAVGTASVNSSNNILTISGLSTTSPTSDTRQLAFSLTITNPSSVKTTSLIIYTLYNSTYCIDSVTVNTFVITPSSIVLNASLANNYVMTNNTLLTLTGQFSDPVTSGFLTIKTTLGEFNCAASPKVNGAALTYSSCSATSVTIAVSSLSGKVSMVLTYTTPLSVKTATITVSSFSSISESISSGSTTISFVQSSITFTVNNNNLVLGQTTVVQVTQSPNSYIVSQRRIFQIQLPTNMALQSVSVAGAGFTSASADSTSKTLSIDYNGLLDITISGIRNPVLYDGTMLWTISTTDPSTDPASVIARGTANQSSQYTPATLSYTMALPQTIIETTLNASLSIVETLSYYASAYILIKLPSITISTPCINIASCSLLADGTIRVPFQSKLTLLTTMTLPSAPGNYQTTVQVFYGNILLQIGSYNYTVGPMTYSVTSLFSGFMSQSGVLDVNFTKRPSTELTVSHNSTIFQSASCIVCTSSRLQIGGIVNYFSSQTILIQGKVKDLVYASVLVNVNYPCVGGCQVCSGSTCTQCYNSTFTSNNYLYSGYCLSSCPDATYNTGSTCINCPSNCQICPTNTCTQCAGGYYLYEGSCLAVCPDGYIPLNGTCTLQPILCSNNCLKCASSTICTQCASDYSLYKDLCYNPCPKTMISSEGYCVTAPTPLQEANHFPFPFLIASSVLLLLFLCFKCFDRRSSLLGNYISFSSLLQLGAILMFLAYMFLSTNIILAQALCFIVLLTKLAANIFFLVYFIKQVAGDPIYQNWVDSNQTHKSVKLAIMCISVVTSFQAFRVLYSRLLGLEIFFAKFSSAQLLKPMAYLNIIYFVVCSGSAIALALYSLAVQNVVRTSLFYSSIEIIMIEVLLFAACLADDFWNPEGHFQPDLEVVANEYSGDKESQAHLDVGDPEGQRNIAVIEHPDSENDTFDKQPSEVELKNNDENQAKGGNSSGTYQQNFNVLDPDTYHKREAPNAAAKGINMDNLQASINLQKSRKDAAGGQDNQEFFVQIQDGDQRIDKPAIDGGQDQILNDIPQMESESDKEEPRIKEDEIDHSKSGSHIFQLDDNRKKRLETLQKEISSRSSRRSLFRRKPIDGWRQLQDLQTQLKREQYEQVRKSSDWKSRSPNRSLVNTTKLTKSLLVNTLSSRNKTPQMKKRATPQQKQQMIASLKQSRNLLDSKKILTKSAESNRAQQNDHFKSTEIRKKILAQVQQQRLQEIQDSQLRKSMLKERTQMPEHFRHSSNLLPATNTEPAGFMEKPEATEYMVSKPSDEILPINNQEYLGDSASDHNRNAPRRSNLNRVSMHQLHLKEQSKGSDEEGAEKLDDLMAAIPEPGEEGFQESSRLQVYEDEQEIEDQTKRKRKKKKRSRHHNSMTEKIYLQRLTAGKQPTRQRYDIPF